MRRSVAVAALAALLTCGLLAAAPALGAQPDGTAEAHSGIVEHGAGHGGEDGGEEHHGQPWAAIFFNFTVFVGILVFFLHRPIRAFFSERRASIEHALAAAEKARAEAQAKLAEAEKRLTEVEADAEKILADARRTAEAERQNILDNAGDEAERVLKQAEARVSDMEGAARRRLRVLAADLAVELARERVASEIKPEDRQRIFERNLAALQSQG